jgi:hypothetical protein
MIGHEHAWSGGIELDHRHPGAHRLDGEDQPPAEDLGEVARVRRDVTTRRIEVIEVVEERHDPAMVMDSMDRGLRSASSRRDRHVRSAGA